MVDNNKMSKSKFIEKSTLSNSNQTNSVRRPTSSQRQQKPVPKQNGMKMIFMKLKQKCNLTKKTEISNDLLETFNRTKQYSMALNQVAMRIRDVIQPNLEYTKNKKELVFEAPENLDEYEQIYSSLEKNRAKGKPLESYENVEFYSYTSYQLAQLHREFHRNSAETLKPISNFLYIEFPEMEAQLEKINHLRDDKDVKEYNFESSGVGAREAHKAAQEFEKACSKLQKMVKVALCSENIIKHVMAIKSWQRVLKQHHEKMVQELEGMMKKCDEPTKTSKEKTKTEKTEKTENVTS